MTDMDNQLDNGVRLLRRSPLGDRAGELADADADGVCLAEEPFLAQVNLRVHPDDPAVARLGEALGNPLPLRSGDVHGEATGAVLWLGPDEWLVIGPDGSAPGLVEASRTALGGSPGSVVDVSANRTTIHLAGPRAREVLESVCSLDLHPRAFAPGRCAQTLLGRTQAVLWQLDDGPGYRILVRNSFACYLVDLLLDSMTVDQSK